MYNSYQNVNLPHIIDLYYVRQILDVATLKRADDNHLKSCGLKVDKIIKIRMALGDHLNKEELPKTAHQDSGLFEMSIASDDAYVNETVRT